MQELLRFSGGLIGGAVVGALLLWWPAEPRANASGPTPCAVQAATPSPAPSTAGCEARREALRAQIAGVLGQLEEIGASVAEWPRDVDPLHTESGLREWFASHDVDGITVETADCEEYPCILTLRMPHEVWKEVPMHVWRQNPTEPYWAAKAKPQLAPLAADLGAERFTGRAGGRWGIRVAFLSPDAAPTVRERLRQRLGLVSNKRWWAR